MNATVHTIQVPSKTTYVGQLTLSIKYLFTGLLITMVLFSALAVVYIQAQNRILINELQSLQQVRDELDVEWGQLLLEESTLSTQARVQMVAHQQLKMIVPEQKNIEMIRE